MKTKGTVFWHKTRFIPRNFELNRRFFESTKSSTSDIENNDKKEVTNNVL